MKKLVVIVVGLVLLASVCWADELSELKLKKDLLETQISNLQLQVQIIQQSFNEKQKELAAVNDLIKLKEPKKEEPKK